MKKTRINEEIVITRPSTTLIQSKFVLHQTPLFELSKHRLQSKWLKPHSQAMYIHLFHQMVRQHIKYTPKHAQPQSTPVNTLFAKYFDMTNISNNIKPCIKNRLSQDTLQPSLHRKIVTQVQQIKKQQYKLRNTAKNKILQLKEQDPMRNSLTPNMKMQKERLRFNYEQNNMLRQNRNALGVMEKKSPSKKQQGYGLEAGVQKHRPLLKHKKCLSNLNNYQNLDFLPKDDVENLPKHPKMSNYYKIGLPSQYLTKHTSPQKSLKSSRKSSLKKESLLKKQAVKKVQERGRPKQLKDDL